ncbi:hypothetical protein HY639_01045 [Candidatus Woesearchaeota archaeon]|nr:hypothetical protein [Candidatus Woesearchaeota archaeon]
MVSPLELRRKMFHMAMGGIFMFLFLEDMVQPIHLFVLLVAGGIVSILSRRYKIPGVWWMLVHFDRPQYLASFPGKGAWFFVLGFLLTTVLFEKEVALASLGTLVIGDALSHVIGVHFGQIRHPFSDRKFIEGHIAGALASAFVASFFVPWWIGLLGALVGMFLEGVDIVIGTDPVDDNVVIPLAAGAVMMFLL